MDSSQPPSLVIPEGYKWVLYQGGWTLIPITHSELYDLTLEKELLNDEEMVDWGEIEEQAFLEGNRDEDTLLNDADTLYDLTLKEQGSDVDLGAQMTEDSQNIHSFKNVTTPSRRSSRPKKPSTRWNEESGFIAPPPKSSKKKGMASNASQEGTPSTYASVLNSWTDAQILNYSKACGIDFLGSPTHKLKCLATICGLESSRAKAETSMRFATTTPHDNLWLF